MHQSSLSVTYSFQSINCLVQFNNHANCNFAIEGLRVWNNLPVELHSSVIMLDTSENRLKAIYSTIKLT